MDLKELSFSFSPVPNWPIDEGSTLWRYEPLKHFQSEVESKGLYFSHPSRFKDQDEGSITKQSFKHFMLGAVEQYKKQSGELTEEGVRYLAQVQIAAKCYSAGIHVNCWQSNPHESALMWEGRDPGIVLKTSVARLRSELAKTGGVVVPIKYIDFLHYDEPIPPEHAYFYKRLEYAQEQEVRAVVLDTTELQQRIAGTIQAAKVSGGTVSFSPPVPKNGRTLNLSLESFVEEIRLSPSAELQDIADLTERMKALGCKIPILQSSLSRRVRNKVL